LEVIGTLSLLLIIYLGIVGYIPMRQRFKALGMLVKWKDMMEKQTDRKIKELQIENVGSYKNQFL